MKKYASQFNQLLVLAEKEKSKKKGGSMAAIFKLIQDLAEFEENIQECINAQEMAENKSQIEAFLVDIDKMYESLFNIGKSAIQTMRSERVMVQEEETPVEKPVEKVEKDETKFSTEDLQKQLDSKPKLPVMLNVPSIPSM